MGQTVGSRRRWVVPAVVLMAVAGVVLAAANVAGRRFLEKNALTTGPGGSATPAVPYERVAIPSGKRKLDSFVVTADKRCGHAAVIVIYHSSHETISDWVKAQQFLYRNCVSSIVFDPTGSGNSPRPARLSAVNEDAVAAFEFAKGRFSGAQIFVLGHSLGNGPMLEAVPHFSSAPAGVIVANTFLSLRSEVTNGGSLGLKVMAYLAPDWWDNESAVTKLKSPVLVIHSDKDEVNPVEEARVVFGASHRPRTQIILYGFNHNALYEDPTDEWWAGVFGFLVAPIKDGPNRRGPRNGMTRYREAGF